LLLLVLARFLVLHFTGLWLLVEWLEEDDSHTVVSARDVVDDVTEKEVGDVVQVIERGTKNVFPAKIIAKGEANGFTRYNCFMLTPYIICNLPHYGNCHAYYQVIRKLWKRFRMSWKGTRTMRRRRRRKSWWLL